MHKLSNIQILRGVAAFLVVVYHVGLEATATCSANGLSCKYDLVFGIDGVMLFFMISGFIMMTTCWNTFSTGGASWDFLYRRATRIIPLYWLITSLVVIGVWYSPSSLNEPAAFTLSYVLGSYFFVPMARLSGVIWPIANLGWTLNLEMYFYLFFAVALLFSRRVGMILMIVALALICGLRGYGLFSPDGAFPAVPLYFWGDPCVLNFVIGMFTGVVYMNGYRAPKWLAWALAVATVSLAFWLMSVPEYAENLPKTSFEHRLVYTLPVLPLFLLGALGRQLDISKAPWGLAFLLGNASYSIYLVHPLFLRAFREVWVKIVGPQLPVWSFIGVSLIFALFAGLATYWLIEQPLGRFFARQHKRLPKAQLQTSST